MKAGFLDPGEDGSMLSSPVVDEHVVATRNTKDVNVGQTPISVTVDPNLEFIRAISELFVNTAYGFFLGKRVAYPVVNNYDISSYVREMIELRVHVELKDTIVVVMPKIDECPKNIGSGVTKNLKNPSQALRGIPKTWVQMGGLQIWPVKRPILVDLRPWNMGSSTTSATHIIKRIDKHERLIIDGKLTLLDDEGNLLEKVDYSGDHDSEDKVKPVDNEMASFMASKRVDYGTNSLLEQRMETYDNAEYDYDPYNDDMYKRQEILDNIQSMCDNLDIKVGCLCNGQRCGIHPNFFKTEYQFPDLFTESTSQENV
nr:hypothetical protein [Tanacetum cinerariifolium]GEV38284.1 hypothetical protein [Tanacetum cinerariifolium]